MGELVRLDRKTMRSIKSEPPLGPGRVLLFTGVRYERRSEEDDRPQPDKPQASPGRKRRNG